jgi:hypothetical protein
MRESELERKFCRLVGQSGGKAYKFTSPGNSGVPDRLVVLPEGRIGFVELKQRGKQPGRLQQFQMAELERLGCYTAVVDSMESGATVIDEMLRQKPTASDQDKLFLEMVNRTPVWKKGGVQ